MARNQSALEQDLTQALELAQRKATSKTFDPDIVDETDDMATVIKKVSEATAKEFARELAKPLAKIIHEYGTDTEFIITGLKAPDGPVTGILVVKP